MDGGGAKTKHKIPGQPLSRVTWAYVCGGVALVMMTTGRGATLIPLVAGIFGAILAVQLLRTADQRHGIFAGALNMGAVLIWITHMWPVARRYFGV